MIIRSYRRVFEAEHRVRKLDEHTRIDKWIPDGVPILGVAYFFVSLPLVLLLAWLPVTGMILGVLPPLAMYAGIPFAVAWFGTKAEPDGIKAHQFLANWAQYQTRARRRVAGARVPAEGSRVRVRSVLRATRSTCGVCDR